MRVKYFFFTVWNPCKVNIFRHWLSLAFAEIPYHTKLPSFAIFFLDCHKICHRIISSRVYCWDFITWISYSTVPPGVTILIFSVSGVDAWCLKNNTAECGSVTVSPSGCPISWLLSLSYSNLYNYAWKQTENKKWFFQVHTPDSSLTYYLPPIYPLFSFVKPKPHSAAILMSIFIWHLYYSIRCSFVIQLGWRMFSFICIY